MNKIVIQQNINITDLTPHRALSDCEALRRLMHVVGVDVR